MEGRLHMDLIQEIMKQSLAIGIIVIGSFILLNSLKGLRLTFMSSKRIKSYRTWFQATFRRHVSYELGYVLPKSTMSIHKDRGIESKVYQSAVMTASVVLKGIERPVEYASLTMHRLPQGYSAHSVVWILDTGAAERVYRGVTDDNGDTSLSILKYTLSTRPFIFNEDLEAAAV
jgi:hypothetical protein